MCSPAGEAAACSNSPTDARSPRSISAASRASSTSRLSNALNSGIRRIAVATQYKAHSLIRHLQRGWNFFRPERNESFDVLPASQRVSETMWYLGTADAVYQNIDIIESYGPQFIVLLAGDHVYKMDYEKMLQQHVDSGADVTVGCLEASLEEATGFGVMHIDAKNTHHCLPGEAQESAAHARQARRRAVQHGHLCLRDVIPDRYSQRDAADPNSSHDFGKDIIPYLVKNGKAVAHHFSQSCVTSSEEAKPYWRDVGTVDAYWGANIDLTDVVPDLDLYDRGWPIWTYGEITPPAKFVHDVDGRRGLAVSSLLSGGCIISGASLSRSLIFTGVRVHSYSTVHETVVLPYVTIGRNVRLAKAIIDSEVRIPDGLVVGEDPELDAKRFRRTENGVTPDHPADDRQTRAMSGLKVLSVASEIFPLVKTGGLADVVGALPAALARENVEIRTLVPGYPAVMAKLAEAQTGARHTTTCSAGRRASSPARRPASICSRSTRRISTTGPAIPTSAPTGSTGPTMRRGSRRSRGSAPTSALGAIDAFRPEVVHAHDWQAALAPAYLHYAGGRAREP